MFAAVYRLRSVLYYVALDGFHRLLNLLTGAGWESLHSSISFRNQHRLMLGGSYTLGNPYSKPVRLLLGAGMGNSYISVHDKTTTNYYLSTGLNFEFRSRSTLSLGVKYTDQLKVNSGRFKEQKLSFFLNLTFSEKTYKAKLK